MDGGLAICRCCRSQMSKIGRARLESRTLTAADGGGRRRAAAGTTGVGGRGQQAWAAGGGGGRGGKTSSQASPAQPGRQRQGPPRTGQEAVPAGLGRPGVTKPGVLGAFGG